MSYSSELKKTLKEISMKKKCCRRAFYYGESLFTSSKKLDLSFDFTKYGYSEGEKPDRIIWDNIKCPSCRNSFLRGVFCGGGTVSDPEKSFHFEIKCENERLIDALSEYVAENCLEMKKTVRGDKFSLYLKRGDDIEDIMHYMGAGKEAFAVANEKIKRNISNQANRRSNFEVVNIQKTVNASQESVDAIKKLEKKGLLNKLPRGLEETARLRLDNPFANLEELAEMHSDRISKSGVNHRLKKLIELADLD
ncbi:MAG: DNA-binding protein WhiA [Clostridia bacterium]|nr:DNA-binding protein WhiA [Clostridia bacterium]